MSPADPRIGLSKRGVSLSDAALPFLVAPVAHGFGNGRGAVATRLVKKLEQLLVKGDRDLAYSHGTGFG